MLRLRRLRWAIVLVTLFVISLYYYDQRQRAKLFVMNVKTDQQENTNTQSLDLPQFKQQQNEGQGNARPPDNSNNQQQQQSPASQEDDLIGYEILTIGTGASRVGSSNGLLPGVSVPRRQKFPPSEIHRLPSRLPIENSSSTLRRVQAETNSNDRRRSADDVRRKAIRDAFMLSWQQYERVAWGYDEVRPVSEKAANPFMGWAATMVDALDTLIIMGLDDQVARVVQYIATIDFTATFRNDIPLFETVIRYLGGLLSGYDLTEGKYPILLEQAKVLGDNLIGAFDTPNRMPVVFYPWQDKDTKLRFRAGTDVTVAELGTLTLEFARLAQLTGNDTYYDAIDRVTDEIIHFSKYKSPLPGLLPLRVDASGCELKYSQPDEVAADDLVTLHQVRGGGRNRFALENLKLSDKFANKIKDEVAQMDKQADEKKQQQKQNLQKREEESSSPALVPVGRRGQYRRGRCSVKGLDVALHATPTKFTFGGGVDSVYEYYMKTYQLLGGTEDKYRQLYLDMLEPAKKHIIYKPKVRNNEGILFLGGQSFKEGDAIPTPVYDMQHLTCFAGGMFALGGKLLDRPEDIDLADKVTQGCVWAYNATRTGVMPESFAVDKCPGDDWNAECIFDDSRSEQSRTKEVTDHLGGTRLTSVGGPYDQPPDILDMSPNYYLRPEAIESVFYMYRITGDEKWREQGWNMISSVLNLTAVRDPSTNEVKAYSGAIDVTDNRNLATNLADVEESFWMGETLKYAYLLFDDFDHISLDQYVFNTEAHPFKLV
jgi:mannosyl-oligosaccharide alpha-1,2-mannosidase